jgi:hypothetical protein
MHGQGGGRNLALFWSAVAKLHKTGMLRCTLGCRCTVIVVYNGNRTNVDRAVMQRFCRCRVVYQDTMVNRTFPHIENVHNLVEVQMEDPIEDLPYKFMNLCYEIMNIPIQGMDSEKDGLKVFVFDSIIPICGGHNKGSATVTLWADCATAHQMYTGWCCGCSTIDQCIVGIISPW